MYIHLLHTLFSLDRPSTPTMVKHAHLVLSFKVEVQVECQAVKPMSSAGTAMLALSQEELQEGARLSIPALLLKVLHSVTQHTNVHLTSQQLLEGIGR